MKLNHEEIHILVQLLANEANNLATAMKSMELGEMVETAQHIAKLDGLRERLIELDETQEA